MNTDRDLPRDIGGFIRDLRRSAQISLRQLAEQAGVSNPYLSQIERGLRKPSAEVLSQLAHALRVSTPLMYLRAGLLDASGGQGVLAAIAADDDLTIAQKQSLTQIYETFRRENLRSATGGEDADPLTFDPPASEGTQRVAGSEVDESAAERGAAGTRTARKTAATRKAAATGEPRPADGADETTPARKPRKVAKRQPRPTRSKPDSEAPSVEGSGTKDAKERTEETA
ncbi:helix-turn-helix transcriptional regulator [Planosporangium flavigriseum]|uniref:helix-turn-helix domain-containing protein n=1 Tax=Planosporangium flavigriseum TaxID=373681 RepID=UPI00143B5943|nr:helix-turn-helix transcriptional regulator [Planosporangium flavigriseum]NJC63666.1 helix-turn-helix transcriptional regulator [Planosporangium flavigriseum]